MITTADLKKSGYKPSGNDWSKTVKDGAGNSLYRITLSVDPTHGSAIGRVLLTFGKPDQQPGRCYRELVSMDQTVPSVENWAERMAEALASPCILAFAEPRSVQPPRKKSTTVAGAHSVK